jgi:hypothetical protein
MGVSPTDVNAMTPPAVGAVGRHDPAGVATRVAIVGGSCPGSATSTRHHPRCSPEDRNNSNGGMAPGEAPGVAPADADADADAITVTVEDADGDGATAQPHARAVAIATVMTPAGGDLTAGRRRR